MLFLIRLGNQYGTEKDQGHDLGVIYGPYRNGEAVKAAIQRKWPNASEDQFLVLEGQVYSANELKEEPKQGG